MQAQPIEIKALTQKFVDDFWKRVTKTDTCWIWTGVVCSGYGHVSLNYHIYLVHRIAYYFRNKVDPYPYFVLHTCDNPVCVNPSHLYLGTQLDNMKDMIKKGRKQATKGVDNYHAKLTESQVLEIRSLWATGTKYNVLAPQFNVSESLISMIVNHKIWRHI